MRCSAIPVHRSVFSVLLLPEELCAPWRENNENTTRGITTRRMNIQLEKLIIETCNGEGLNILLRSQSPGPLSF